MPRYPEILEAAFARIAEELRHGEVVCLFPEGRLTSTGDMGVFRPGIERVLRENPVPLIPMHLSGLWRSLFSRYRPRRPLHRVWSRVRLEIGAPLPPEGASAALLEARVRALAPVVADSQHAGARDTQVAGPVTAAAVLLTQQRIDALSVTGRQQ
ncbi:MAG TPA: 1-acyl-sn-glycerol-3-phosphate acyltransferase [Polyangiaceae bacterium]